MKILNVNLKLNLAIILIIFFHGLFLSIFSIHPKVSYSIVFLLYFLVVFFNRNTMLLRIDRWLFYVLIVLMPSVLVGLYLEWSYIDISADIVRYLAPFLGYVAGVILLKQLDYDRILYTFYVLLAIQLILYYYSLISKASYVLQGGPIVEYASLHGLEVQTLFFLIVYFLLKNKVVSGFKKVLLIGYAAGFILNPILLMSKARLIAVLLTFALIFILYSNIKDKVLMILFALFFAGTSFLYFDGRTYYDQETSSDVTVYSRIQNTIELVKSKKYLADASTSFRVAEITNLTGMLHDKAPYSLFFGFGSGALYYDDYAKIEGGIVQENFRPDGGVHDIFFVPLAYVFRYGFIGLFLMLYFIVHFYRKILINNTNLHQNGISKSLKIFIIISFVADLFVGVHIYGNFDFGFYIAFAIVLQNKFNVRYNSLH